jgi:hypothetical protein
MKSCRELSEDSLGRKNFAKMAENVLGILFGMNSVQEKFKESGARSDSRIKNPDMVGSALVR